VRRELGVSDNPGAVQQNMIGWLLLLGAIYLAFQSPWWWIAVGILAAWKIARRYFYKSMPWRRVHYPMMRAYAAAAGHESGLAERDGRPFEVKRALRHLLSDGPASWSAEKIEACLDEVERMSGSFGERELLAQAIRKRHPNVSSHELDQVLQKVESQWRPDNIRLWVELTIGEVIRDSYGEQERAEYLYSLVMGKAT
jgi:hypothetical protein